MDTSAALNSTTFFTTTMTTLISTPNLTTALNLTNSTRNATLPYDQFCEYRYWRNQGNHDDIEYAAAGSAAFFVLIPLFASPKNPPMLFQIFRANFVVLGVSTFLYHWLPNYDYSSNLDTDFDWAVMATTALLLMMLLINTEKNMGEFTAFVILVVFFAWFYFLMLGWQGMEKQARDALKLTGDWGMTVNVVLVALPVLVFAAYTFNVYGQKALVAWVILIASLAAWVVNKFYCEQMLDLALLHSVFHAGMATSLWLGARLTVNDEPPKAKTDSHFRYIKLV